MFEKLVKITEVQNILLRDKDDRLFYSLDIARGFAALWVVMLHTCWFYPYYFSPYYGKSSVLDALYFFMVHGIKGVSIFFIVSGYCVCVSAERRIESSVQFLMQRIKRIYPPYVASLLIGVGIAFLMQKLGSTFVSIPSVYEIVISLPLFHMEIPNRFNAVYWTLPHFVHFYIVVFLSIVCFRRRFVYMFDVLTALFILTDILKIQFEPSSFMYHVFLLQTSWFRFYCGIFSFQDNKIFRHSAFAV